MAHDPPSIWDRFKKFAPVAMAINAVHSVFWIALFWSPITAAVSAVIAAVSAWYHPAATYPVVAGLLTFFSILGIARELKLRAELAAPKPATLSAPTEAVERDQHGVAIPVRKYTQLDRERLGDAISALLDVMESDGAEILNRRSTTSNLYAGAASQLLMSKATETIADQVELLKHLKASLAEVTRKYPAYATEFSYVLGSFIGPTPIDALSAECKRLLRSVTQMHVILFKLPMEMRLLLESDGLGKYGVVLEPGYHNYHQALGQFEGWRQNTKQRALTVREKVMAA